MFNVFKFREKRERRISALKEAIEAIKNDVGAPSALEALNTAGGVDPTVVEALKELRSSLRKRENNRFEILNMVSSATASMEIEKLLEALMPKLIENTKSAFGAFYLANNATGKLEIKSSVGFSRAIYAEFDLTIGEGIIGLAAKKREITLITELPDDSVYVTKTLLGSMKPKNLMLVPIVNQETLLGVLALGSLRDYTVDDFEIVDVIKYYVGAAVANGVIFERSKRQARELEFQNQLIQGLNGELETKVAERGILLNDTLNSIKDYAIYTTDADGVVLLWNAGAEIIFGFTAEEAIGQNITKLLKAEEFAKVSLRKRFIEVKEHGRYFEEGWRRRNDGKIRYVSTTIFGMYGKDKRLVGVTNVTHDITELKNSQDELILEKDLNEKLFEYSNRGGIITDYNDVVITANKKARAFFGESENNKVEGRHLSDLFEDISPIRICVELTDDGFGTCELTTANGVTLDVELLGVRDANGYFVRLVLMFSSPPKTND